MNYGIKGVKKKQEALNSKNTKVKKMGSVLFLKVLFTCAIAGCILLCCVGIGMFKGILSSAPDISELDVVPVGYATVVYDCEGNEMTKLVAQNSNRTYVSMDKIPQNLADAFVAIEDSRFYSHNGIDIKGIFRAGVEGIRNGFKFNQGASTITQQLLKNNVFEGWVTEEDDMEKVKRKIQEQYLAIEIEKKLEKEEILELYMNSINLGQNTLGVQAASMRYFGKPVYQLNLSECAVIAGITQNPSKFNPISHPDKNAERREKVLDDMKKAGFITQQEYDEALADNVYERIQLVNEETDTNTVYTYFVDELTEQVIEDLQEVCGYDSQTANRLLYSGGLSIFTTQDPQIQAICNEVFNNEENYPDGAEWLLSYALTIEKANGDLENHSSEMYQAYYKQTNKNFDMLYDSQEEAYAAIEAYKEAHMATGDDVRAENITLTVQPQVSITIEDHSTGYVVAMVGGRGVKTASRTLNRATDTKRQPGSTFKVLSTFAPALDTAGMTLADIQVDAPFNYADGRPVSNWYSASSYKGICSMRYAIEQSLNICTVKFMTIITPQVGFDYLQNFGFTTLVDREITPDGRVLTDVGQSLALGGITYGVTNMELNAAYGAIANSGVYLEPTLYTKILDSEGNVLIDKTNREGKQVIQETTAYLLTSAMIDVVTKGTGGSVNFGNMAIAGKTGTTQGYNDVWFAGYTPYYTATVWTGFDNNKKLNTSPEKNLSKTLWRAVMSRIHEELPNKSFSMPNGIVTATVCSRSGKLPIAGLCDHTLTTEYFTQDTVPTETCNIHYAGIVCEYSGLCACENCPFAVNGTAELPVVEHPSLQSGSLVTDANGNIVYQGSVTNMCPHNVEFFLQPNYMEILQQQMYELEQRRAAAAGY
ncbi:MAG: PBP1A family penicillin-binding protein [Lachnospiraceae bacterium]|nr:PBP1A family penicillin-binding protein [Lachnospiraceae bacterium]